MVLRIGAYPNRHSEKHNVHVPRGGPIIDGWVRILLKIQFRGERILRGSKFNVTDPLK